MKQKQKELQEFYKTKFENFELSNSYSSPLLISLDNEKINTDIMVENKVSDNNDNFHSPVQNF